MVVVGDGGGGGGGRGLVLEHVKTLSPQQAATARKEGVGRDIREERPQLYIRWKKKALQESIFSYFTN